MSTIGRGPLNPTRFERDAIVQLWVDRRDLTTIGKYMETQGIRLRHMSDLLRFCVDNITEIISRRMPELKETNSAKATEFLENRLGVVLNYGNRGRKNYVNNLLMSADVEIPNVAPQEIIKMNRSGGISIPHVISENGYSEEDIAEIKRLSREQIGSLNIAKEEEK
jgi:hypothetical protein